MPPVNQLPDNTDIQPTINGGLYGAGCALGSARIVAARQRLVPGKRNEEKSEAEKEWFIDIGVYVEPAELPDGTKPDPLIVNTSPFNDHTRLTPNSGSKATKFLTQLGVVDVARVDLEAALSSLVNREDVVINVAFQHGRDNVDRNWIRDISTIK